MVSTLQLIQNKYGSIDCYLDLIGFEINWRERLIVATSIAAEIYDVLILYIQNGQLQSFSIVLEAFSLL